MSPGYVHLLLSLQTETNYQDRIQRNQWHLFHKLCGNLFVGCQAMLANIITLDIGDVQLYRAWASRSGAERVQDDNLLNQSSQPLGSAVALHWPVMVIQFLFEKVCFFWAIPHTVAEGSAS